MPKTQQKTIDKLGEGCQEVKKKIDKMSDGCQTFKAKIEDIENSKVRKKQTKVFSQFEASLEFTAKMTSNFISTGSFKFSHLLDDDSFSLIYWSSGQGLNRLNEFTKYTISSKDENFKDLKKTFIPLILDTVKEITAIFAKEPKNKSKGENCEPHNFSLEKFLECPTFRRTSRFPDSHTFTAFKHVLTTCPNNKTKFSISKSAIEKFNCSKCFDIYQALI